MNSESAVRALKYWYEGAQSIGVIGDLDTGPIYRKLSSYLLGYLQTKCKEHNVHPKITKFDSQRALEMSFKNGIAVRLWTGDVSLNLETQVARALKHRYAKLKPTTSGDQTVREASNLLKISKESVIRESVSLLERTDWFRTLTRKLKKELEIS